MQIPLYNMTSRAFYHVNENDAYLSIRKVHLTNEDLKVTTTSYRFTGSKIEIQGENGFGEITVNDFILDVSRSLVYARDLLESYSLQIEILEDQLFDRKTSADILGNWFRFKKDLSALDRTFARNAIVLRQCLEDKKNAAFDKTEEEILSLITHMNSDKRKSQGELSKLEMMYSFYTSLKSDKLNQNIYVLAFISGVFLPLNLVVGFFGMNTTGMFFAEKSQGTILVLGLLIGVFITLVIFGPILKIINRLVIRGLLEKTDVYKTIRSRIKI